MYIYYTYSGMTVHIYICMYAQSECAVLWSHGKLSLKGKF